MSEDSQPFHFTPPELQLSKFRFYSAGKVLANKALSTDVIEVLPVEDLVYLNGEVNSETTEVKAKGTDAEGRAYETSIRTTSAIQARWLRLNSSNRLTAPDVTRGAPVMIYQFGDADDQYYWTTWKEDVQLRTLETVIWGISAKNNYSDKATAENMYYFEVSSHTKRVTFHTSRANGERFGYDVQIDADRGFLTATDHVGNSFTIDSAASRVFLKNVNGTIADLNRTNMNLTVPDTLTIKANKTIITGQEMAVLVAKYALNATTGVSTGSMSFAGDEFKVTSSQVNIN